jgi:hypothetical protein
MERHEYRLQAPPIRRDPPAEQTSTFDPQDRRTSSTHGHGKVRKHSAVCAYEDGSDPPVTRDLRISPNRDRLVHIRPDSGCASLQELKVGEHSSVRGG